jgi:hypothetical protein
MNMPDLTVFDEIIRKYDGEFVSERVYAGIIKPCPVKIHCGLFSVKVIAAEVWTDWIVVYWLPGYSEKYTDLQQLLDTIPQMTIE